MKYYIVHCYTGYVGSDSYEAHSEQELNQACFQMACDNASMYGYEYEEEDEDGDGVCLNDSIEGYPEPYDPQEHDCYRSGGGSFKEDFDAYPG